MTVKKYKFKVGDCVKHTFTGNIFIVKKRRKTKNINVASMYGTDEYLLEGWKNKKTSIIYVCEWFLRKHKKPKK